MNAISVVHLVWGPLEEECVKRFADSYREHPAGADHELVVAFNGVGSSKQRSRLEAALHGLQYRALEVPQPVIDLEAYRWAVDQLHSEALLFCNSYTRILCDGWLDLIARHLTGDVGMVGASGTYESIRSSAPPLLKLRYALRYPGFPNPHLRSTGFMLRRELIDRLDWTTPISKEDAYDLENGKHSLTRQVEAHGRQVVIAGRDGKAYAKPDWRASETFRSGEQSNLILADNRTDDFLAADAEQRAYFERLAWGR